MSVVQFPLDAFSTKEESAIQHIELDCTISSSWKLTSWEEQGTDQPGFKYRITRLHDILVASRSRVIQSRAYYETPDGTRETELLVCKIATGNQNIAKLREEAKLYDTALQDIQGKEVPKFFGLYERRNSYATVGVMILEHCGEPPVLPLGKCDFEFRWSILCAVRKLHIKGKIIHTDLKASNILVGPNRRAKIIDFDRTQDHSSCPCTKDQVTKLLEARYSIRERLKCNELQTICEEIDLTPFYTYYDKGFDGDTIRTAEDLAAYAPDDTPSEEALTEAEKVLQEFREWRKGWVEGLRAEAVDDFDSGL